jgi:hypothetical protein
MKGKYGGKDVIMCLAMVDSSNTKMQPVKEDKIPSLGFLFDLPGSSRRSVRNAKCEPKGKRRNLTVFEELRKEQLLQLYFK